MPATIGDVNDQLFQMVDDIVHVALRNTFKPKHCRCEPNTTALVKYLSARAIQTEVSSISSLEDADLEYMKENLKKEYGCDC